MNTLTKVLIVLTLLISTASAAIIAALHAQRVDWHDKFVKEVNQHYYTVQVMRAEVEAREIQVRNLERVAAVREDEIERLRATIDAKESNIAALTEQLGKLNANLQQTLEHAEALNRQLSVLVAMQQELHNENIVLREQRDRAIVERQQAQTQIIELQGRYEVAMRDLDAAEAAYIECARKLAAISSSK